MKDFKNLKVWERAHHLALAAYQATADFPPSEIYALTNQIRRAASSIPANIAEGYGRGGDAELARYLNIALGSATELEYHLMLARDLAYLNQSTHEKLNDELMQIQKMLTSFQKRVRSGNREHRGRS